ncbi:MAG TPA: DUF6807 family protein [Tepidisphaeraceae bacterium]|nr:DUF6807 family protein [Tepidisphaeraceae bacterium]
MVTQTATALLVTLAIAAVEPPSPLKGKLALNVNNRPFATWSPGDGATHRPHFFDLRDARGARLTRNHPPEEGVDPADHADMHPGLWLAFGDVAGKDFWRNKGPVVTSRVVANPSSKDGRGTFTVSNEYRDGDRAVCRETCRYAISNLPSGVLLTIDSTFSAAGDDVAFGDQEEMGLGVRVATPLSVKQGGRILDGEGRRDEKEVWGKQAAWCDYGGRIDGKDAGIMLVPHPDNFRRCRFHARDYGLLVANPFGVKAFNAGPESRVVVKKGENLRLRFGVLARTCPGTPAALTRAYEDCLREMNSIHHGVTEDTEKRN